MSKNSVQLQKSMSVVEFMKLYGSEEQCRSALFQQRWVGWFSLSGVRQ